MACGLRYSFTMPLAKLDHFLIRAKDLSATRAFYEDVLGMRDGARPPFPFPGNWLYVGEAPVVHLVAEGYDAGQTDYLGKDSPGDAFGTGVVDHIAFLADDLEAMMSHLEAVDVRARRREVAGLIQLFIEDPNGITIELNFPTD